MASGDKRSSWLLRLHVYVGHGLEEIVWFQSKCLSTTPNFDFDFSLCFDNARYACEKNKKYFGYQVRNHHLPGNIPLDAMGISLNKQKLMYKVY